MPNYFPEVVDLVAISILVFGIYLPRHRRTDLALAYVTVNIGVLIVADTLEASAVAAGLGLGLFGVLSIIRLRSEELSQREIAYYFVSLAIALVAGLADIGVKHLILMALLLLVIAVVDSKYFYPSTRQTIVLDRAFTDHREVHEQLESLYGHVVHYSVENVDCVKDSTTVTVTLKPGAYRTADVETAA